MNFVIPGSGTILAGYMATSNRRTTVGIGLAQLITLIIGYIWGIAWALRLYKRTVREEVAKQDDDDETFPPDEDDIPRRPPLILRFHPQRALHIYPPLRVAHVRAYAAHAGVPDPASELVPPAPLPGP